MSGKKPDGVVPKLRFPEFEAKGTWKTVRLHQMSTRLTERVGGKKLMPVSITAGAGFVSQIAKFGRDISGDQYKNYIRLTEGDFSYNKGNSKKYAQGCIYKLKEFTEVAAPYAYISFRLDEGFNADFYQYLFEMNAHGKQLQKYITSGARSDGLLNIDPEDFFQIELPTPSLPEQQKIADCLTLLDEVITAEARKLDALKAHKKGLMQQLFPAEGETVPKRRFPEFRDSGEWALISFENLNLDVGDGNYSAKYPKQSDFINAGVPFLRANNIRNGTVSDDDMRFISREQHAELQKGHLKAGDILLSTRGELGNVALVPERHIDSNINAQLVRINAGNSLSHKFLFQVLDYCRIVGKFEALSTGTALKQLPIGKLNMLELNLPKTVPEQQKIADCLTSLDELITAQAEKIEALKAQKKGLLQGLFPQQGSSE